MSTTIKDIAKMAGVSHTTVSRALNDSPLIHPKTKDKIKTIAKQLNYTPNFSAKSLVSQRSYQIGLFFSTLQTGTSASFFYDAVRGVNGAVVDRYNVIVKGIDEYRDYRSITRRNFDGIIAMSQSAADEPFIRHATKQGIPIVVLNRRVQERGVTNILSDDRGGANRLVRYLISQGHRDIAIIEGKRGFESSRERKEGYLEALAESGIEPRPEFQSFGDYDMESGYRAMKNMLMQPHIPTAVFCSNDEMAVGALKAAAEQGVRVPADLSIAGFDDAPFSAYVSPPLTTVRRPIETVSKEGAARLLKKIEVGGNEPAETTYLKTELIIRDSIRQLKGEG